VSRRDYSTRAFAHYLSRATLHVSWHGALYLASASKPNMPPSNTPYAQTNIFCRRYRIQARHMSTHSKSRTAKGVLLISMVACGRTQIHEHTHHKTMHSHTNVPRLCSHAGIRRSPNWNICAQQPCHAITGIFMQYIYIYIYIYTCVCV
jgi:hypothetical protein